MSNLKLIIRSNIKNIGKKITNRKLVIFECDDCGSNRIWSKESQQNLIKLGLIPANDDYRADTLARKADLEYLFDVLTSVKDSNGNGAVFTPFVNPVNPDFEKIKQHGYNTYFYEDFTRTLERFGEKDQVMKLWDQGVTEGIFIPAYHGREHLCVPLWMEFLQKGDRQVLNGFENNFYSVKANGLPSLASAFRPALFFSSPEHKKYVEEALVEGLRILKNILPKSPEVFCPPNGISHPDFDRILSVEGIKAIVVNRIRKEPNVNSSVDLTKYAYASKNGSGQYYYYRNCSFEPVARPDVANSCLKQIEAAFRWNKPAVISTHRVNFSGSIEPGIRENGLRELKKLLQSIQKRWPDAEFVSSNEIARILNKQS